MSEKKNPNDVAAEIQAESFLMFLEGRFYRYQDGVYRPIRDIEMNKTIKEKLGEGSRIRQLEEVYAALSIDCHKTLDELPRRDEYLNILNGMLSLKTATLTEHSPEFYSIAQFPINFRREATCPLFLKTIHEWLDGNEQCVKLVQEFLGYCLTHSTDFERMLFLLGDGANGKTTLMHVIRATFGIDNCSHIGLEQLSDRFGAASLRGKLINLSSESPSKAVLNDDIIKRIVSGEPFQIEEKYKPPYDFRPAAKLVVGCNVMPATTDKSNAINRRLLILNFNRSYSDLERDVRLADKLSAEKEGIFRWCVVGLLRLRKRGHFDEPQASIDAREEYQAENNSVIQFVEEECWVMKGASIPKAILYKAYHDFCITSGLHPFSKPKFGKEVKRIFKLDEKFGDDKWGDRARIWIGIDLLPINDPNDVNKV